MREYLDASDIANNAMMAGETGKTVVIVEGVTDKRLYTKFLDPSVLVIIAHSKNNVIGAVTLTSKRRKCEYVVGIVDADLDYLNYVSRPKMLFQTDTRDSETLMFRSSAYDDVAAEYFDSEKASRFEKNNGNIRDAVMNNSYPVGLLMFLSEKYGWKLSFKDLDFESFIDRKTLNIDVRRFVDAVTSGGGYESVRKTIYETLKEEMKIERNTWHVCRGHDVMKVLAIGMFGNFGSWNCKHINDSSLSGAFRLAFDNSDFVSTELYSKSKAWSEENKRTLWKEFTRS